MKALDWLQEPEVKQCPMDGPERLAAHRRVVERKTMIRSVFTEFHELFSALDQRFLAGDGLTIELGAGVYPVRRTYADVLATDVVADPILDRTLNAGAMDVADGSVRAFYLQNVFHHFPRPRRFFSELVRTLQPGGGAILIEPGNGLLARLLYPILFASEGYDVGAAEWETDGGPMTGANQALSHLVFDRDLLKFGSEFPDLEVVHRDVLGNWLRYLASGGLNFRPLVPATASPLLRGLERLLRSMRGTLGLHRVIVLRKRTGAPC